MATLTLRDENRVIRDPVEIGDFLESRGLGYQRLEESPELPEEADAATILAAFEEPIGELKSAWGYRTADVVRITPDIPELDAMLARFEREHTHDDDEVRLIVDGRGLFHVHPKEGPVFCIEVEAGDLIRVPGGTRHWFHVCAARRCRAVRLFQDTAGWTPHYTDAGIERRYPPVWRDIGSDA